MPRHARLDGPGTLHHVIVRGIEQRQIVDDEADRARQEEEGSGLLLNHSRSRETLNKSPEVC